MIRNNSLDSDCKSSHLCVYFIDDPLKSLTTSICIEADIIRQYIFHVSIERHAFYAHRRLLSQKRFGSISRVRSVLKHFIYREKTTEGHICRLKRHLTFIWVHYTPLAGVANFWRSNYLRCEIRRRLKCDHRVSSRLID